MNTVLLETKQDYIDYCIKNDVLNTSQKYGSQYTIVGIFGKRDLKEIQ